MKRITIILMITAGMLTALNAQHYRLNAGLGYAGSGWESPGLGIQFELERIYTRDFSLPGSVNLTFMTRPDYYSAMIELHKGFRKQFSSGVFVEQFIGAGLVAKRFKTDGIWYTGETGVYIPHGQNTVYGFMPSVTGGIGYAFTKDNNDSDLIWIRPKIYWDLGSRGLNLPYSMLQIGYTHSINTK